MIPGSPSASRRGRVFTIPASAPFLPTLVRALVEGQLIEGFKTRDPLELARVTIYLPTKRSCVLAREAFLEVLGTDAAVLPRIVPIGSIDEDEFAFAETAEAAGALDLPPSIGGFERRALLAQFILKWAASPRVRSAQGAPLVATSPSAALALADDLARLMDDMTTREVPWSKLETLVPENFDQYWQLTLEFLEIASKVWPQLLADRGAIEPAERRDRLIAAEAERLKTRPNDPVIAAGSTGSMPATAKLIATIAKLPHGAVVLPGLDMDLDEPSWKLISGDDDSVPAAGHAQFALHGLLARMEIERGAVDTLGTPTVEGREALASEALRPALSTHIWPQRLGDKDIAARIASGLANLTLIEAANAEEEALAIAIALREAVVTPGKTAALITPDRALARRVTAALQRWRIDANDTGGDPLSNTPAGVFARLAAEVALDGLPPVSLLALLKHPLFRLGDATSISALERAVLRGPRPRSGSAALSSALKNTRAEWDKLQRKQRSTIHRLDPQAALTPAEFDAAAALVAKLTDALKPLEEVARSKPLAFGEMAKRHREVVERLSADGDSAIALLNSDGKKLGEAFADIESQTGDSDISLPPADYAEFFLTAIAGSVVRWPENPAARVRIYGLLEARLTDTDRVVLGGLAEGIWPPEVRGDPWLSRPMRHQLGLNLPELRIGLTAHDFAQLLGAREVFLTRATKLGGAPTVASRFLQRLGAVAGERWKDVATRGNAYLDWARNLDHPAQQGKSISRPEPKPPREARPRSLSVTEIDTWLRDPYSIYARHILNLRPLDDIDTAPGARDRGTLIHGAIDAFAEKFPDKLPENAFDHLIEIGKQQFAALDDFPEARAFWWPRYERIARWFADYEKKRRAGLTQLHTEIDGRIEIPLEHGPFILRTRADRIEKRDDGRYAILDYKTGRVPTLKQVKSGFSPQLTLEAAILLGGGFKDIAPGSIAELVYIALKGDQFGGEEKALPFKDTTPDDEANIAQQRLTKVIAKFDDPATGYLSRERPMFMRRGGGDYDHLARVKEWSLSGGGDDEGGDE
jgi:ATP-dependent helicase/nuclease subunit B